MAGFGEIVDRTFVLSPAQIEDRRYGFSRIRADGVPTVYYPGDVINLPFFTSEVSNMQAIGLAWGSFSSGVVPDDR